MKLTIDLLNLKLSENNQLSKLSFYSANPKMITLNGIDYIGNDAIKIIRRINSSAHWIENFDKIYLTHDTGIEKQIKSLISAAGGKVCQRIHGAKIKDNLNTGIPWNKDSKGVYPYSSWCKGLTKTDDERLQRLSDNRTGSGNPMFGTIMSDIDKTLRSSNMKQKILDGTFTPNSNNRNTHWVSYYREKKFRSSWEAIYYSLNVDDLYESLRIPYTHNGESHIYIVDFVNHHTRTATEIKSRELLLVPREQSKIKSLTEWCDKNNYRLNIVTQDEIEYMSTFADMDNFDPATKQKLQILNETYKKNRNR